MRGLQERRAQLPALTPASTPAPATRRQGAWRAAGVVIVAAAVVAVDQVTKTLALRHLATPRHVFGTIWLDLTFNSGAAFGLGGGATPVVEAVVVALLATLAVLAGRATRRGGTALRVGLGLLIGGAVGNLADRLFRAHGGAVIDFVDAARLGDRQLWPVFNVADAAVVVGAIVVGMAYAFGGRSRPDAPEDGHD